jgi:hypothetical protein
VPPSVIFIAMRSSWCAFAAGRDCHPNSGSHQLPHVSIPLIVQFREQLHRIAGKYVLVARLPDPCIPLLACLLSRRAKRDELSVVIRELREEYAASRKALREHLEQMWTAPTLKKQLRLLFDLEKAGEDLFRAAFPQRVSFLDTAWSVTVKAAEARPLSAVEEVGKSLLRRDQAKSAVSAIGFARQLTSDLRRIAGLANLLRNVLSLSERERFGVR